MRKRLIAYWRAVPRRVIGALAGYEWFQAQGSTTNRVEYPNGQIF